MSGSETIDRIEKYTRPLCSNGQYESKLANFRRFEASFRSKAEHCQGLPIQLHLEPSGDCNLLCPICPRGRGKIPRTGLLSFDTFRDIFDPFSAGLCSMVISGFGEPLLNPATTAIIRYAASKAVPAFLNTNGTRLFEQAEKILDSCLASINISLDGAVSKSCHRYNPQNPFAKVVQGVQHLSALKARGHYRSTDIVGQFIIPGEEGVGQVEQLTAWALSIGIEQVKFKRMHKTMPSEVERSRIDFPSGFAEKMKGVGTTPTEDLAWSQYDCSHPWDSFFLGCNGEIGLCSFDPRMVIKIDHPPSDPTGIWNSEGIKQVRRWHSGKEKGIQEPCLKCNRLPGNFWM
jgi:hypothetical protein